MATFKLSIWYAASEEDKPQVHTGLETDQAQIGLASFWNDMARLEGEGVRKVAVEVE